VLRVTGIRSLPGLVYASSSMLKLKGDIAPTCQAFAAHPRPWGGGHKRATERGRYEISSHFMWADEDMENVAFEDYGRLT
jgi:hypothetical protein